MAPLTPDLAGRPTSRQQEWIFCFLYQFFFLDLYALNCKIFCPDLEGKLPAVAVQLWSDNLTHLIPLCSNLWWWARLSNHTYSHTCHRSTSDSARPAHQRSSAPGISTHYIVVTDFCGHLYLFSSRGTDPAIGQGGAHHSQGLGVDLHAAGLEVEMMMMMIGKS